MLHFLPPYSPEHNVIERLWKQMHDHVTRNHRHPTMKDLILPFIALNVCFETFPEQHQLIASERIIYSIREVCFSTSAQS